MNTWVEPPPPRRQGLGCFARGCLILLVFGTVLAIACFAGIYWGLQQHSAIVHGIYWLAKTHSIAEAPVPVPEFNASENQIQSVQERWQDFEQKTRAGQPAEIELTADDINILIVTNRDIRGKVFVSIDGSQLHLQTSIPFGELLSLPGYYFNDDITVEFKDAESLENPQLSRLIVNEKQVPSDLLSWKYRSRRLREYVADYRNDHNVGSVAVRDGKVILRSRTE
jgi:hypothetical protein